MKKSFPAGSTAILFFLLAIFAWLKGGAHMLDIFSSIQWTGTDADAEILSANLGTDATQHHLKTSQYAFIARDLLLGLSLLFALFWLRQRFQAPFTKASHQPLNTTKRRDPRRRR